VRQARITWKISISASQLSRLRALADKAAQPPC
jgi:hypothetical protein